MNAESATLLIAGAGLAGSLTALRVAATHPGCRVLLCDAAPAAGGNHTWSFHAGDVTAGQHAFLDDLVEHRWPAQSVSFPAFSRRLEHGYLSITTASLVRRLGAAPNIELRTGEPVAAVEPDALVLASGERISGLAALDARGPAGSAGLVLGFQKFFGREVVTRTPHGITEPVIMDATVSQTDGYRFVYLLPFEPHRLLIEDTYYSDGANLSRTELDRRIDDYAAGRGWSIERTVRDEHGVLPILLAGDFERFWPAGDAVARAGLRAGLFHPTTGYSLPQAAALAERIATAWPLEGRALAHLARRHAHEFWQRTGFFRLLNRMLFRAGRPEHRYRVLERFYTLDAGLITNFYAASLTLVNQLRIVSGKPPVPLREALAVANEKTFLSRELAS